MIPRRQASILAALALLAAGPALAADLAAALQGKWKTDMTATLKESPMYQKLPPDGQKKMLDDMAMAPDFLFEFTDKTIVATPAGAPPQTATYSVLKSEGKALHLQVVSKKDDGTDAREETDVEMVDHDNIKISKKGDDMVLVLRRVK